MKRLLTLLVALSVASGNAQGQFVNFESAHVRPLALSPDADMLYALNTPDNRVELFRVTSDGLVSTGEVVVGLEPVAMQLRTPDELWVVNHLSDSVSVVDVSDPARPYVRETLPVGDEPRDVVFAGPRRASAFITTAHRGQNRPGDPQLTTPGVGRADVWVFNATDASRAPRIVTLFCDTPRALAVSPDGTRVYAAAFHSGNRTSVVHESAVSDDPARNERIGDGFTGRGPAPLPDDLPNTTGREQPETGLIVEFDGEAWRDDAGRDWTPRMRFNLPDKDVFVIDAMSDPPAEIGFATGVGTTLFNMAVHPVSGEVWVSNQDARNHIRFEPRLRGYVADSRLTRVDFANADAVGPVVAPIPLNSHIDYGAPTGTPQEIAQSLAIPLAMTFAGDGSRLYVAAFGSHKVAVLDASGAIVKRLDVGAGPSGLALDEERHRLYVLNRLDQTISIVDTTTGDESRVVPLRFDPEPPEVRDGRRLFYDAARSSGHGDASCATCHVFADLDALAWDLGDPGGAIASNPAVQPDPGTFPGLPLRRFHPLKGPMTTQSLRGLSGAGAMHWRGDRNGGPGGNALNERASFMKFRPAFESLLGRGEPYPLEDMETLRDFVLSLRYPPNPIARLDGSPTPEEAAGRQLFLAAGEPGSADTFPCARCHRGSIGTGGGGANQPWLSQDFKIPHLRNLYQKVGMFGSPLPRIVTSPFVTEPVPTPHLGDQVRGFGFRHDGAIPTVLHFLRERVELRIPIAGAPVGIPLEPFRFRDRPGRSGDQKVRELEAFLFAFDTGLPSHVGQQVTLSEENLDSARERFELLRARTGADFVAHGRFDGELRGFLYVRPPASPPGQAGTFLTDRNGEEVSEEDLLSAVRTEDALLTFTVVPQGSGERIAIDRDGDGTYDGDELDRGSDPADPDSLPSPEPVFLRGDCSGDGTVDISDAVLALGSLFLGDGDPGCDDACDSNDDGTVDISDAVNTLGVLFLGNALIPLPGMKECGGDPTDDNMECETFSRCP